MATIDHHSFSHQIDWRAEVYCPDSDDLPASVTLLGHAQLSAGVQISGLTPDQAETIASELIAAATRARRATAQRPAQAPDGAPLD